MFISQKHFRKSNQKFIIIADWWWFLVPLTSTNVVGCTQAILGVILFISLAFPMSYSTRVSLCTFPGSWYAQSHASSLTMNKDEKWSKRSHRSLVNPLVFVCQKEKRAAGLESGRDILSQSAIVSGKNNGSSAWCVARRSRLANYIITARRALVIVSSRAWQKYNSGNYEFRLDEFFTSSC